MLLLAASTAAQLLPVPVPPENPITEAKRVLGKVLFWEEQMASDHRVACGTCHMPAAGGIDPRAITANHPGSDGVFGTSDDRIGSPECAGRTHSATTNRIRTSASRTGSRIDTACRC